MEHDLYLMLGRLEGQMKSLIDAFGDEREQARGERISTATRLDVLEALEKEIDDVHILVDQIQKQTYSNKAEVDAIRSTIAVVKSLYSKAMAVIGAFGTILAMFMTGLWWIFMHWNEVFAFIRGKP